MDDRGENSRVRFVALLGSRDAGIVLEPGYFPGKVEVDLGLGVKEGLGSFGVSLRNVSLESGCEGVHVGLKRGVEVESGVGLGLSLTAFRVKQGVEEFFCVNVDSFGTYLIAYDLTSIRAKV